MLAKMGMSTVVIGLLSALVACDSGSPRAEDEGAEEGETDDEADEDDDDDEPGDDDDDDDDAPAESGALFILDNADGLASVVMYQRDQEGALVELGSFPTGGMGTGGGLGSQGGVVLADGVVYTVNPGDDTVSALRVFDDHLSLEEIVHSDGAMPTSITVHGDLLYVLNAGGAGSLRGFTIGEDGLEPIEGASVPLSGAATTAPAQVGVSPDGAFVVVTERATNQIITYEIGEGGRLDNLVVNEAEGQTPFGFEFRDDGVFVVSEAFGGPMNPGASAVSSQRVSDGGTLWTFSSSVPNGQTAACWVEIVRDQFVYTTNTASNSISAYEMSDEGALTLFPSGGVAIDFGDDHSPLDMIASEDEKYLYVLNGVADEIVGFVVEDDGGLTEIAQIETPEFGIGLAGH